MNTQSPAAQTMRTLRFHSYGEPSDVLRLEEVPVPAPIAGTVIVRVHACGLNPADWALCRGLFHKDLPRGIGLDVAGTVTAIGEGVTDVALGDRLFGPADYLNFPTAGASDFAALSHWAPIPAGLDFLTAASLPMAVETGYRYIAFLDPRPGETLVVNGAGTMIGFAAVQIALLKGVTVIATAGPTFADQLRSLGARVTPHGEGMVERIAALLPGVPDHVLDVAPVNLTPEAGVASALSDLVKIAGGDPKRVVTVADFAGAAETGVRTGMEAMTSATGPVLRYDKLGDYARHAAEGRFSIPISRVFSLEEWRAALDISLSGRARGKLMLQVAGEAEG
jgi:NADPH:quinone reductase-like Zn-dependent oxidoreductase